MKLVAGVGWVAVVAGKRGRGKALERMQKNIRKSTENREERQKQTDRMTKKRG